MPASWWASYSHDRTRPGSGDRSNAALIEAGHITPGLSDASVSARLDALSRQLEAAYPAENKQQVLS